MTFPNLPKPSPSSHASLQASHLQVLWVGGVTGGAVGKSCHPGHVEKLLTFQSPGTAELQHAPANGAGAVVDELRRGEHNHPKEELRASVLLRPLGHHGPLSPAACLLS